MTPRRTRIESLGVYLPPRVVTTAEIVAGCRYPLRTPLETITGIRSRRMAGDGEYSIDLAERAAIACFERSVYGPSDIDLIIACHISRCDGPGLRMTFEPSTAAELARRLGMRGVPGFNVSNACAGMMTGMLLGHAWLRAGALRRVLVVAGEHCSHIIRTAQLEIESGADRRIACLTAGDAGAALILDEAGAPGAGLHFLELYTLGRYCHCCVAGPTDRLHGGAIMHTDAVTMAAAGRPHVMQHALAALAHAGWQPDDVRRLIPHQTSRASLHEGIRTINALVGRELCTARNVVDNLRERGNTGSTTHAVALHDLMLRDDLRSGDRVLLSISGSGLCVGTALYELDDLPERLRGDREAPRGPPAAVEPATAAVAGPLAPVCVAAVGLSAPALPGVADTVELSAAAALDCLARAGVPREEVDLLIFAGQYRSGFGVEPAVAALLAGRLRMNDDVAWDAPRKTLAFDVNAGAGGLLFAVDAAAQVLRSGAARCALVVAAEVDENLGLPPGDAGFTPEPPRGIAQRGSAVLLRPGSSGGFGRVHWSASPELADRLQTWVRQEGGRTLLCVEERPDFEDRLLDALSRAAAAALAAEGLRMDDVDLVVGPQRPGAFRARLSERLGIGPARLVDAQDDPSDLFTSSLPTALGRTAALQAGILLLLDGGAGVQAGATVYRQPAVARSSSSGGGVEPPSRGGPPVGS